MHSVIWDSSKDSHTWMGWVCNYFLRWHQIAEWQSRSFYWSPPCDIPLFRHRELWAAISHSETARVPWFNRGGYQSNCNFKHALFNNSVRSVKLQDYLHFEKHWQGNCRNVLWSLEAISQHLKRYTSFGNSCVHNINSVLSEFSIIISLPRSEMWI